jgi:subtilisin-like proprotein convertase family protein
MDLVAPDGSVYNLRSPSRTSDAGTDLFTFLFPHDLSDEAANGTWVLRVRDDGPWYTGYIDNWTLDL